MKPCPKHPDAPRFYGKTGAKAGKPGKCKECHKEYQALHKESRAAYQKIYIKTYSKPYYHKNKERLRVKARKYRHNGDETPCRVGKCPVCGNERRLCYDHCHKTDVFRGWVCSQCNSGIGLLGDDIEGVEKALAYLRAVPSA